MTSRDSNGKHIVLKSTPLRCKQLVFHLNENWSANPGKFGFIDLLESIFLTCDMHFLSGVTFKFSYLHSHGDFHIISEDAAMQYKIQRNEEKLYDKKLQ